ncbi:MAG: DUF3857 domain-containing transglutaminase family protein [Parvularculaceae bacterium]
MASSELARSEDGVFYLLLDSQKRVNESGFEAYQRTVRRVTGQSGLESAGRLEFGFDPQEDEFRIHAIKVVRDGVEIDRFDPLALKVVSREPELSDGVTDGDLTAYYEIPDIRVGDIVDYEVSWNIRSRIWPGEYFNSFSVEWSVPVAFSRTKLILPADKPLTIAELGAPPNPEIIEVEGGRIYQWVRRNSPVIRSIEATPPTFPVWSSVSVSTIDSWRGVAQTLLPAYEAAFHLPDDLAEKIVPAGGSLESRITAAIRFVQDQIRYVADESGVGSHLPRAPATVVERGWGDCKDKATLLVAILRQLGVEAYVALTDNDAGSALPQQAPSPYAFDHAIVVAVFDGERRWIDATISLQGGVFPNIEPPAYGYGLPLKAGVDGLWPIEVKSSEAPALLITEAFDFAGKDNEGVAVAVTSNYRGVRADSMRLTVEKESTDSLSHKYFEYYAGLYPGIERTTDIVIVDDRDNNELRVEESYLLPAVNFAEDEFRSAFPIQADAVRNQVKSINTHARQAPVALPFPLHVEHVVSLKNTGVKMSAFEEFSSKTDDFEFVRNAMPEKDSIWISWRFKTLANEIPATRIGDYGKLTEQMDDWNVVEYNLADGDALNDSASQAAMVALLLLVIGVFVGLWGAGAAIKSDNELIARSVFHPVEMRKFLILGFSTLGVYAVFWMFRCWRAHKRAEGLAISPAARTFFAVIFFYPLFSAIRRKTPEGEKPPIALGAALAASWGLLTVISSVISNNMKEPGWPQALVGISDSVIFLAVVPLVMWVNRLNRHDPEIIARHSQWRAHSFAALFFGFAFWAMILIGSFLPE